MLIQCTIQRPEPVIVPIGNETYTFEPDDKGRLVADVWKEDHVECFLAVPHLYRKLGDGEDAGEAATKRSDVMAELKRRAIPFKVTAKTDELRAQLAQTE
jgi:hypothetical protein